MKNYDALIAAMSDLDEETVVKILTQIIAEGGEDAKEAMEACQAGMKNVGDRFATGEYFVGDLIFAGELMQKAVEILQSALLGGEASSIVGRMIMCTVKDDLHDIGKNIVGSMLKAGGLEVIDLGIDVAPETIVETAKKENIQIIGLSGVLTLAIGSMKATVDAFREAGLRDKVKIIIGGAPTNEVVCKTTGADAWAINPQDTVNICRKWAGV